MKKGCLFLIALWAGLGLFWYQLLESSPLSDNQPWVGILLGLSATLVVANLMGLLIAVRQLRASSKSPGEWAEGDLICVSGQIRAAKDPIISPLSGKYCSIVEYEIRRGFNDENQAGIPDFRGMLMAPSTIQTMRGAVRIIGFPLLSSDKMRLVSDEQAYRRAAEYLANTEFKVNPKNPLKLLKELSDVLKDNDGDVKADFQEKSASVESIEAAGGAGVVSSYDDLEDSDDDDDDDTGGSDEAGSEQRPGAAPTDRLERIAAGLQNEGYCFKEVAVENGTDVTVFGTYKAQMQAVDISGGLSNLNHQFHLGQVAAVVGKQVRNTALSLVFWTMVFTSSHYWVLEKLGYDVKKLFNL